MTVNSRGDRGQPIIQNPPTRIPDMMAISNHVALMGTRIAGTASARTAFSATFGFTPFRGLEYFELDTFNSYTHDGTQWIGTKTQAGIVAFSSGQFAASGGGFEASVAVNFVTGRFTVAPAVNVTPITGAAQNMHAGANNITATGFTLYFWRANQTATSLSWSAVPTEMG